jgi:hypothetical protein
MRNADGEDFEKYRRLLKTLPRIKIYQITRMMSIMRFCEKKSAIFFPSRFEYSGQFQKHRFEGTGQLVLESGEK